MKKRIIIFEIDLKKILTKKPKTPKSEVEILSDKVLEMFSTPLTQWISSQDKNEIVIKNSKGVIVGVYLPQNNVLWVRDDMWTEIKKTSGIGNLTISEMIAKIFKKHLKLRKIYPLPSDRSDWDENSFGKLSKKR